MLSRLASRVYAFRGSRFFSQESPSCNWDILSGVCLERRPVITKELTDLEKVMLSFCQQTDVEESLKSDFEIKQDTEAAALQKKSKEDKVKQKDDQTILTQDMLDVWVKELQGVVIAPRLTDADKNEDVKSTERKLDSRLFLLIKQENTGDHWVFPQDVCKDGETLRESAERTLLQFCGPDLKARFLSNAPCGFFKYKYPKKFREREGKSIGAKVFFYKAELLGGQVNSSDFQWRTKSELLNIVDKNYGKSLDKFLFDDS